MEEVETEQVQVNTLNSTIGDIDKLPDRRIDVMQRLGFYAGIEEPLKDPRGRLEILINEQKDVAEQLRTLAYYNIETESTRSQGKIEANKALLNQIQDEWGKYEEEIEKVTVERGELQISLNEVKDEIFKFFKEFGERKKTILDVRINEVQKVLDKLIIQHKTTLGTSLHPYNDYLADGGRLIKQAIQGYESLSNAIQTRIKEVNNQLERLDASGMSPTAFKTLTAFGTLAAVVAGWFLSVFTGTPADGWKDASIFQQLFEAFQLAAGGQSLWKNVFYLFGGLAVITILSYYLDDLKLRIQEWRKANLKNNVTSSSKIGLTLEVDQLLKAELWGDTWFEFWLEVLPIILIGGLITIVTSHNSPSPSVSGAPEYLGIFMSTGLGALYYLYFSYKANRRAEEGNHTGNSRYREFTIALLFGLLINLLLFTASAFWRANYPVNEKLLVNWFAMGEFIFFANIAGMAFAYGLYCKGLISNSRYLERKFSTANELIKYNYHTSISWFFDYEFGRDYKALHVTMLDLLSKRISPGISENSNVVPLNIHSPTTEATILTYDISLSDRQFYPELAIELDGLNIKRRELERKISICNTAITEFENKTSERSRQLLGKQEMLETEIKEHTRNIDECPERLTKKLQAIQHTLDSHIMAIRSGFDLGWWYRQNNIGPVNNFYNSLDILNPDGNGRN